VWTEDADISSVIRSRGSLRLNRRLMAYSAAAMYGAAVLIDLIEGFLRGGPSFSMVPGLVALAIVPVLLAVGPRLPRWALAPLGPIGVGLIASALATVPAAGDGAVLYMWPVLWTVFFFGLPGALSIVACIGVAHGIVLLSLPPPTGYFDRWVDVMVSVSVVAAVVLMLTRRNEELLARLAGEARTDKLTGLLNRRGFEERASVELAHARREGHAIAVVSFDIDYFKRVNDEWGHGTGDRVLVRLGAVLNSQCRDVDVVARIGGEEFVVLLPATNSADADVFTQRIRRALAAADASGLPTVRVSAGVAAAIAPANVEPLLHRADSALYAAKRAGRDRTVIARDAEAALASGLQASVTP
jgi:diguanylate cyclase (GGDEF)-like protein